MATYHIMRKTIQGNESDDDGMDGGNCPLGCGCQEKDHHYLTCPNQPGHKQIMISWQTKSLKTSIEHYYDTHPDVQSILLCSILTFLTGGTPTLNWYKLDRIETLVKEEAFHEQTCIGWKHVFLGQLSMKWKYVQQQQHYTALNKATTRQTPFQK